MTTKELDPPFNTSYPVNVKAHKEMIKNTRSKRSKIYTTIYFKSESARDKLSQKLLGKKITHFCSYDEEKEKWYIMVFYFTKKELKQMLGN